MFNVALSPPLKSMALLFTLSLLTSACENKQEVVPSQSAKGIDPSQVKWIPTTLEEKNFVANLGKVTAVFKEIYKDRDNVSLVKASVYAKVYTDESILLKDLIFPESSILVANEKFNKICKIKNLHLRKFSDDFWKEVRSTNDLNFIDFLNKLNISKPLSRGASNVLNEVSVYYPYSIVFQEPYGDDGGIPDNQQPMTVVTATADADQGWGYVPYRDSNGIIQYEMVLVDDYYAEHNPTQIIGVNGVEPYYQAPSASNLIFTPSGPIQTPGLPRQVKQVYVSHLRCKKHYDNLVSATGNGGGNEMVFTRGSGFLKLADGRATGDVFSNQRDISRWHITNNKFHDFDTAWDGDWEAGNKEQNIGLYEKDNRNEKKLTGSLKTTLTIPNTQNTVEGNIGFEIVYKSDDNIIFQENFKHDVFFILNRIDLEGAVEQGWFVRRKTMNDSYTLADRTLVP